MGLDSIEILMKVEKTFGINIPDQEAEKIITVGDFHNAVWRHVEGQYSDKCKSQALFYKLRQSFCNTFNFPKTDFKLNTSLDDIFPKVNRRQTYLKFAVANSLKLPELELTKPWRIFISSFGAVTIIGGLCFSIILINFFEYTKWTLLIPVAGLLLTLLLSEVLNPKRVIIELKSIKDFINETLAINYSILIKESGANRKEVESVINHIISDMCGLELDEITSEKKIHDDLGID